MPSTCYICKKEASFCVKDTDLCYCTDHAKEFFADISYLSKIAAESSAIKRIVDK